MTPAPTTPGRTEAGCSGSRQQQAPPAARREGGDRDAGRPAAAAAPQSTVTNRRLRQSRPPAQRGSMTGLAAGKRVRVALPQGPRAKTRHINPQRQGQ